MEDEIKTLVKRAQNHNIQAFEKLYRLYYPKVYRYIFFKVGIKQEVEDLTQEVFLKAVKNITYFKWKGFSFSSWLFRIAYNTTMDYFRRYYQELKLSERQKEKMKIKTFGEEKPKDIFPSEEWRQILSRLPEKQRQVLLLKFAADLNTREIARVLKKSEGAVKLLQHRGLKSLKGILERNAG